MNVAAVLWIAAFQLAGDVRTYDRAMGEVLDRLHRLPAEFAIESESCTATGCQLVIRRRESRIQIFISNVGPRRSGIEVSCSSQQPDCEPDRAALTNQLESLARHNYDPPSDHQAPEPPPDPNRTRWYIDFLVGAETGQDAAIWRDLSERSMPYSVSLEGGWTGGMRGGFWLGQPAQLGLPVWLGFSVDFSRIHQEHTDHQLDLFPLVLAARARVSVWSSPEVPEGRLSFPVSLGIAIIPGSMTFPTSWGDSFSPRVFSWGIDLRAGASLQLVQHIAALVELRGLRGDFDGGGYGISVRTVQLLFGASMAIN